MCRTEKAFFKLNEKAEKLKTKYYQIYVFLGITSVNNLSQYHGLSLSFTLLSAFKN